MKLTRRGLLGTALAAPALITVPARAAVTGPAAEQNAGWYRFSLGSFQITVASDGNLTTPTATIGANRPRDEVVSWLEGKYLDPASNYAHTNHILIDTGDAKVLVDVGSGNKFQPSAGRLVTNLEEAGVDVAEITHVALTHAHPDHVWGVTDDFGDEFRIPEAEYAIGATEFDWWTAEDRLSTMPEVLHGFVVGAQNALNFVADKTKMVQNEAQIVPGVTMIDTPGHTPGHMSVLVESDGNALLVTGDVVSHVYASFEHPEWHFEFDNDKEMATGARKRLLDMTATDRITIAGYHLPFPGVGHVVRRGDAYEFLPAPWIWGGG